MKGLFLFPDYTEAYYYKIHCLLNDADAFAEIILSQEEKVSMSNFSKIIFKSLNNRRGVSLIEVMLAIGIMTIAGFGVAKLSGMVNQNSTQLKATRVAVTARAQIEAALKNPTAWAQTVSKNTDFKCASQPPGCLQAATSNGYYDFVLYGSQPNEKVSFDAADPTTLYSLQGGPCPAGSVASACPIKYQAQWKPICQSYPCMNPSLEIKVDLTATFTNQSFPFNTKNYSYSTVRGINEDTIKSACLILNGTYNSIDRTCYPKYAGKTCKALGKEKQIVTGVHADGSIDCAPLYHGVCDKATQMMTGIDSKGKAICAAKVQPATCPKNCVGSFGKCTVDCGGGKQFYSMTSPAAFGGDPCPFPDGASQACNTQLCPVDCVGDWTKCTADCGGGSATFVVTTDLVNGGKACIAKNGESITCNTQACAVPVACSGNWSACDPQTGTQTFQVTQAAQSGGAACPASPQACRVDCVGDWGVCNNGAKTYSWSVAPRNGGAACTYPNGQVDALACGKCGPKPVDLSSTCKGTIDPKYGLQSWRVCEEGYWLCGATNNWTWKKPVCARNGPIFEECM